MLQKFLKFLLLPLIVLIVASIQLYKTETSMQSRWKGGGFGMYTDINQGESVIAVNNQILSGDMIRHADFKKKFHLQKDLLYMPSKKHARALYEHLEVDSDTVVIQVLFRKIDLKNKTHSFYVAFEQIFTAD